VNVPLSMTVAPSTTWKVRLPLAVLSGTLNDPCSSDSSVNPVAEALIVGSTNTRNSVFEAAPALPPATAAKQHASAATNAKRPVVDEGSLAAWQKAGR
jgi:hypothetical protein